MKKAQDGVMSASNLIAQRKQNYMQLPDIKKLKELLKLLRAQGVLQYQSTDLNLILSESIPSQTPDKSPVDELLGESELDPATEIERLVDYSSRSPIEDV